MLLAMFLNFKIWILCNCSLLLSSGTVGGVGGMCHRMTGPEMGAGIKTFESH